MKYYLIVFSLLTIIIFLIWRLRKKKNIIKTTKSEDIFNIFQYENKYDLGDENEILFDLPPIQYQSLSEEKKSNFIEFKKLLDKYHIKYLYHFTDEENISSIKENGGLFSWHACKTKGIHIKRYGSNELSRKLDTKKGLENYIRLCFNPNHPMLYAAKYDGRILKPVILFISTNVIFWKDTLFSNINATSNSANIGGKLDDFNKIKFNVVLKRNWDFNTKSYYQAEILVKEHIPLKYILGKLNG